MAVALDNLKIQIQHNLADLGTWLPIEFELVSTKLDGPCAVDRFLAALAEAVKVEAVKAEAGTKVRAGGVDPEAVEARINGGAAG